MGKKLFITSFIFLVFSFLGLFLPRSGNVVDIVDLVGYDSVHALEVDKMVEIEEISSSYARFAYRAVARATVNEGYGSVAAVGNYISVAGRQLSVVDVDDTIVDSGDHVNKYGARFYYGHNTWNVFGGLVNLGVGDSFSIYYGGVLHNYRVAKTMIYEKNVSTGRLQLNGAGNYMRAVSLARDGGVQYDVSLMTCYGTSYGNGDASHRFVVFANEF